MTRWHCGPVCFGSRATCSVLDKPSPGSTSQAASSQVLLCGHAVLAWPWGAAAWLFRACLAVCPPHLGWLPKGKHAVAGPKVVLVWPFYAHTRLRLATMYCVLLDVPPLSPCANLLVTFGLWPGALTSQPTPAKVRFTSSRLCYAQSSVRLGPSIAREPR